MVKVSKLYHITEGFFMPCEKGVFINIIYKNNNIETPAKSTSKILEDKTKSGKERDWKGKKRR
jgi:hypothetical protein